MKDYGILSVLVLATGLAFYLVWMNRASEKVITATIPIALAAIVGIVLAVLVFGGQAPINEIFPASFMYQIRDKKIARFPFSDTRRFTSALFAPAELRRVRPGVFNDAADQQGVTLYHHLLQREIIDWMGTRYRGSWQSEITHFDLPTAQQEYFQPAKDATEPSMLLSTKDVTERMKGNYFAEINTGIPPQLALPVGTKLIITAPTTDADGSGRAEILMENEFCTLSIETRASSWMRGVGSYRLLAEMTDEQSDELATATYTVRINARFSRMRSGHPKMAKYRAWASQLSAELKQQFDEQEIWRKTKEDYFFLKHVDPPNR